MEDLKDVVRSGGLDAATEAALRIKCQSCREVLWDLNALVEKYNSLPIQTRRTWDRLNWDQQGEIDIRTRLTSTVVMLSAFYESLTNSSQMQIEQALQQLMTEIHGGHRDATSVVSVATAVDEDEDAAWPQIIHDLEGLGVSESIAKENRTFIVDWLVKAVNEGLMRERNPEVQHIAPQQNRVSLVQGQPNPAPLPPSSTVYAPYPVSFSVTAEPGRSATDFYSPQTPVDPMVSQQGLESLSASHPAIRATSLRSGRQQEVSNMIWTAQRIVLHWNHREWNHAEGYLQQQVEAVQAGETIAINGVATQPDLRVLRHLMGVCASFQGDYARAKLLFEKVQRGPYVYGMTLDHGDIAAARWLGETCLHLNEPHNAALAWAIALDGLIGHNRTSKTLEAHRLNG